MKYTMIFCLLTLQLYALDDNDITQEIQKTQNMDELTTQMHSAPRQYRHRYIQAIKERARVENEAKREQLMSELSAEKSEDIQTQQINTLTGRSSNSNSSSSSAGACNGSGKGGNSGNGKGGK
ncbi:hypothetical protein SJPD1_1288 [Sulfurospirillum diekertiae]|uniref:Uncharacterized protein n=1 Tax=Sulfurospirillum diekertiae TaxID=1854492 RepID=A0A290HNU2_9BACT|nr:hypothetical protein [Sulfurospirillum diekertiae]ATB69398.1 hypothetical protein SJPD1_1288 [Sulfurospirillum diekertiae]